MFRRIPWQDVCKFLAGTFFVNAGILFYLYLARVSVPLLGTGVTQTPEASGVRSIVHTDSASAESIMPLSNWATVFSGPPCRNRLESDYLSRVKEYVSELFLSLRKLGQGGSLLDSRITFVLNLKSILITVGPNLLWDAKGELSGIDEI